MRRAQLPIGEAGDPAHQLQRGHLPVALADGDVDRVAGVPGFLAALGLVRRRGHDAAGLADQVDAGGHAEAVAGHVLVDLGDAHVDGQLVVVGVHRLRDRLAQVGPAVAAAVRVAPAAADPGQIEHAGGEDLVLRAAGAAVQAGQAHERLDGGTGRHAAQHQAVELRPRRIAVERLEVGVGNAVDEQVGVVGRQADHRQDLAGARIDGDGRALVVAERGDHGALQVGVDGQAQVGAGLRRHPADGADRAALHVGLDLLVADLAAQLLLVIALQPGLADVGQRRVALAQRLQVLLVDAADVADDVREQVAVGVVPGQVGFQLHAREAPAVHREARPLLLADTQLQSDRAEAAAGLARGLETLDVFRRQRDDLAQLGQQRVHVGDLVRGHVEPERGDVLGQQAAVAVVDHAAPGHHRPWLDAVGVRAGGVDVVVQHLQLEIPGAQAQQRQQHAQEPQRGTAPELLGLGVRVLLRAARMQGHATCSAGPAAARPAARTAAATAPCPAAAPTNSSTAASARRRPGAPPRRRCGR
ncbi:hypothetical protein NB706_002191 [Xanthomonas sacchari]|nr:hypothetical protein [Xanthomonas sacchari]